MLNIQRKRWVISVKLDIVLRKKQNPLLQTYVTFLLKPIQIKDTILHGKVMSFT